MVAKPPKHIVRYTCHLSPHTFQLLNRLAAKLTKDTGGSLQITRTEVVELAIRQMAQNEGVTFAYIPLTG
jgi:hypothetical protein